MDGGRVVFIHCKPPIVSGGVYVFLHLMGRKVCREFEQSRRKGYRMTRHDGRKETGGREICLACLLA